MLWPTTGVIGNNRRSSPARNGCAPLLARATENLLINADFGNGGRAACVWTWTRGHEKRLDRQNAETGEPVAVEKMIVFDLKKHDFNLILIEP